MKVYVLLFGYEYEGYDSDVRVFTSREAAKAEGEKGIVASDDMAYDYFLVKEVEVENN